DFVFVRIELTPVIGARPAARSAVQEDDGLAVGVAAKLPVQAVAVADVEHAGLVWFDGWIKRSAALRGGIHQKLYSSYMRDTSPPHSSLNFCSSRSAGVWPVATTSRKGSRKPPSLSPALLSLARRVS